MLFFYYSTHFALGQPGIQKKSFSGGQNRGLHRIILARSTGRRIFR